MKISLWINLTPLEAKEIFSANRGNTVASNGLDFWVES